MDIGSVQTAITTQLSGAFAGTTFAAQELPDNDAAFQRAVPNPIAYVLYTGSEPIGFLSTDPVVQCRRLKFNVECYSRLIYGVNGLDAVRQLLESALVGFRPPNCDRVYLVKDELNRGEDLIWCHVYNLACETVLVQNNFSEPIVVQTFTGIIDSQATFNDDYNNDFGDGENN